MLYTANRFSVGTAGSISCFRSVTPQLEWHLIRHLELLTIIEPQFQRHHPILSDSELQWKQGCEALRSLLGIRYLRIELVFPEHIEIFENQEDDWLDILEPLNRVSAPLYYVETNYPIPNSVRERLGKLAFTTAVSKPADIRGHIQ